MNDSKLSIKHACAAGAAFLGLLSAAAITAAFLFTRNSTIVWLGLLFILLVFISRSGTDSQAEHAGSAAGQTDCRAWAGTVKRPSAQRLVFAANRPG
ncbi:MAG: hypothetical protein HFF45_12210 [Lawsonibacter sp.]|nr:hypothetical protein [Lawsonibacter sp.]